MAQWRPLYRRLTESEKVLALAQRGDHFALWLYTALLPHTDREGRLNANPAGLAGTIFEGYDYQPAEIERAIHQLADVGLVILYRNGRNQHLVQYTKFQEMCRPDSREAKSELPGPGDEGSETIAGPPPEAHAKAPTPLPENPEESTGAVREDYAETPRSARPLHVHGDGDSTGTSTSNRAREARAGALVDPPKTEKPKKVRSPGFDPAAVDLPDFVSRDVWLDFCDHRKAMRRPLTPQAVKGILAELAKTPLDADAMLRQTITRGWTGVFPLDKDQRNRNGPPPPRRSSTDPADDPLAQYREAGL